ncbi:Rieske (2Fe-2S) protein [Nevskia soli]|jgi:nitrite reductase/ring-hydroxylating ferredoxin subunit|uniref:Rieske (2Fe-2S) protein n=1 Tax=Nevskia soli TaxID=418856 RepID=UPI0015D7DC15|nr:Rieske (2Fe-2S) protein [Nevskia soli]
MAFVKVATLAQLQSEPLLEVMVDDKPYALCLVDGQVHALDGTCPHQGGPLGQGMLNGSKIMCPWHAWEFDCATGLNEYEPDDKVAVFPVKVEGQEVLIDVA